MFLPPVVLAIRSRYVLEAAVYAFTMFFSTVRRVPVLHCVLLPQGGERVYISTPPPPPTLRMYSRAVLSSQ